MTCPVCSTPCSGRPSDGATMTCRSDAHRGSLPDRARSDEGWVHVAGRCPCGLTHLTPSSPEGFDLTHANSADDLIRYVNGNVERAWDHRVLSLAAGLRKFSPGDFERLVVTLKQSHGGEMRVAKWEAAVTSRGREHESLNRHAAWSRKLLRGPEGGIRGVMSNAVLALENDPRWSGVLAWDDHSHQVVWKREPPWAISDSEGPEGVWGEHQDALMAMQLERDLGISLRPSQVRSAVTLVARRFRFHPIQDYLLTLHWDGVPRIATWLARYLGCSAQPARYLEWVGRWVLISAVARAMDPGAKVDTVMVLEGPQGARKSSAVKVLGGAHYVEVDAAILGTTDKDTLLTCRLAWIVEAGEFDSLRDASMSRLKNIVSRAVDTFRAPYGHDAMSVPRGWICIGTTNADTYLRDTTGARRFHPVRVGFIDLPALSAARDQLWAEAVELWRSGTRWHPEDGEERALLAAEQEDRRHTDPWEPLIADWVEPRSQMATPVTIPELLRMCIGKDPDTWTRGDEMRVADCLRGLGWRKGGRCREGERRVYPWIPPVKDLAPVQGHEREPGQEG